MLTSLVHVVFTFYIQNVLKLKKNNSGAKSLRSNADSVIAIRAVICMVLMFIRMSLDERLHGKGLGP